MVLNLLVLLFIILGFVLYTLAQYRLATGKTSDATRLIICTLVLLIPSLWIGLIYC